MSGEVHIPDEAWDAGLVHVDYDAGRKGGVHDAVVEGIHAAAPFIYRAGQIAELEELAAKLDAQIKRDYTETVPGGDVIKDEGWPLYLHYRDVLERIAELEKENSDGQ